MSTTTFRDLFARLSDNALAALAEYIGTEHNFCAHWLGRCAEHEAARRQGVDIGQPPTLALQPRDVDEALAWLDGAAERFAGTSLAAGRNATSDLLALALIFDQVQIVVKRETAADPQPTPAELLDLVLAATRQGMPPPQLGTPQHDAMIAACRVEFARLQHIAASKGGLSRQQHERVRQIEQLLTRTMARDVAKVTVERVREAARRAQQ
ncbi:MAG: hypothetical protein MUE62_06350 [Burkholderiaceae bacterium]|jgi:hypothetical protein|nr:hypothetical protein [Burkholderiaceae bacterium]